MEFSTGNIKLWSMIGASGTFGLAAHELAEIYPNFAVITADLCFFSGLNRLKLDFPEKLYNVGISEQNMIGVAAGMANEGMCVWATTYASFASTRVLDQIKVNMGYMKLPVHLLGLASGLSIGVLGATHISIEDIAIMRAIPNMTVIVPADCTELMKAVLTVSKMDTPTYIRASGTIRTPIVYKSDYEFKAGKGLVLNDGDDAVIYAAGSMVSFALKAAAELKKTHNISVKVVNMHTIKPFDNDLVLANKDYKLILSVEGHSTIGGLGSAVAEVLASQSQHGKLIMMGTGDYYAKAGGYEYMLEQHNLNVSSIVENVVNNI